MTKRTSKAKKTAPKEDRAWFERKVAEQLKQELETEEKGKNHGSL